jgi:hypothetical protein
MKGSWQLTWARGSFERESRASPQRDRRLFAIKITHAEKAGGRRKVPRLVKARSTLPPPPTSRTMPRHAAGIAERERRKSRRPRRGGARGADGGGDSGPVGRRGNRRQPSCETADVHPFPRCHRVGASSCASFHEFSWLPSNVCERERGAAARKWSR